MKDALRDVLKSGPMAEVYARLRRAKRRLRHEPVAGPLLVENPPLDAEELRRLAAALPGHARPLYSLGLRYLADGRTEDLPKALACLRSAEMLGFESPERAALYEALVAARSGWPDEARRLVQPLAPRELTAEENALREEVREGRAGPPVMRAAPPDASPPDAAASVLVVGDAAALTADWFAGSRYLLAHPQVTGLSLQAVAGLDLDFEVVVGPAAMRVEALAAGIRFPRWRDMSR